MLLVKLVVVPVLILAVSLAGRRWGSGVAGLLVGLPWTSGPVLFFLAVEQGVEFGSHAAIGILAGVVALTAFCLVYAWTAGRFHWVACVGLGTGAYLGTAVVAVEMQLPAVFVFAIVAVALAVGNVAIPTPPASSVRGVRLRFDLPLRVLAATGIVLGLTALAEVLGPRLAGLLAPFPVYAGVLAVFAQLSDGASAAVRTLAGVVRGSFSFAIFFLVAAVGLEPVGVGGGFAAATASALSLHVLMIQRHRGDRYREPALSLRGG